MNTELINQLIFVPLVVYFIVRVLFCFLIIVHSQGASVCPHNVSGDLNVFFRL